MKKNSSNYNISFEDIFEDLFHPNPYINKKASLLMRSYWPNQCLEVLMVKIQDSDISVRRKSILALGEFGETIFQPIINLYLNCETEIVRTSCLKVLIKIFVNSDIKEIPSEVASIIDLALQDDSPQITLTVISLLKQIGSPGIKSLMKACRDENILRAKAAVTALIEIEDPIVRTFLNDLANDESSHSIVRSDLFDYAQD